MNKNLKSGNIVIIAVFVAAAAILAFALVFNNFNFGKEETTSESSAVKDEQVQSLETLSNSDEIGAIEADINSTNLENLDQELNQVDQETPNL